VGLELTLDDFQDISDKVPFIADLKPSGKYVMEDLHKVGGVPAVLKYLLEKGLIDGSCMTVTGKTLAENLAGCPPLMEGQRIISTVENPIKKTGHLQVLWGNLAPEGSVAKITGKEGLYFSGMDGSKFLHPLFLSSKISGWHSRVLICTSNALIVGCAQHRIFQEKSYGLELHLRIQFEHDPLDQFWMCLLDT
jgi:hypothetical protein